MKREQGYYWVKHQKHGWIIAFYYEVMQWYAVEYVPLTITDSDFLEIDERRIIKQD